MSAIKIVKGLPISTLIRLKNDATTVDMNDGSWTVTAKLCYQTKTGPSPFDITLVPNGFSLIFELTEQQTTTLNHLGSGYVLVINADKDDGTVFIENTIPVSVVDGL